MCQCRLIVFDFKDSVQYSFCSEDKVKIRVVNYAINVGIGFKW